MAAVDPNPLWSAMALKCLAQESFGGCQIAPLAELELDRIAIAVDGAVQIPPLPTNLDIGFIKMPFAGNCSLAPVESLQQERGIVNGPEVTVT